VNDTVKFKVEITVQEVKRVRQGREIQCEAGGMLMLRQWAAAEGKGHVGAEVVHVV
jgi:hypothetical protein